MSGITIRGTGRFLPDYVAENDEFATFVDTSNEWIVSHTGIERRHVAIDEPTWYMAAEASKKALKAANIAAADIDMIIGTTVTPDFRYPSMACLVQNAIGANKAFCFDISAACAGSSFALDMARRYLATGGVETVLIASSETLSQMNNYEDRGSCILFGDGAGAAVLTAGDGAFGSFLSSNGSGGQYLYAKLERHDTPFTHHREIMRDFEQFPIALHSYTVMDGHEVYRFATRAMPEATVKACEQAGFTVEDLDLLIPHQANLRIIKSAARYMNVPMDKVYVNIQNYGNPSSATLMIALDECVRKGILKHGDKAALVGFGSGLVYAGVALEYHDH